ncbi:MAG: isoaspartyl peptidase/L-asparaginase [Thermoleophilaceae bacterium]|nr:isoaspartyl peptidase/L-asparaginase [Thermoleophilaceae bacterium]
MADFVLAVHGGAGTPRKGLDEPRFHRGLAEALRAGHTILARGGSAVDAVQAAVVALEDDPIFNAGRGAVLNEPGEVEHDAALMCGRTKQAGAVAAVTGVRHPIRLAREVFEEGRHVFIVGDGAEAFADERGLERVDADYHRTGQPADSWKQVAGDTVGAVALDAAGALAAATSTGGIRGKRPGRVGDCPVIGAGTWADTHCAVSASGEGEAIMRAAAAHDISRLVAYKGLPLDDACDKVVHDTMEGEIGVIAVDRSCEVALPFNCGVFHRGVVYEDGAPLTAVGPGEPTAFVS